MKRGTWNGGAGERGTINIMVREPYFQCSFHSFFPISSFALLVRVLGAVSLCGLISALAAVGRGPGVTAKPAAICRPATRPRQAGPGPRGSKRAAIIRAMAPHFFFLHPWIYV